VGEVDDDLVLDFGEYTGATFPLMYDSDGTYGYYNHDEATAPYPLDVIIDQDGVVAYVSTHYEPDAMEAVILELLAR